MSRARKATLPATGATSKSISSWPLSACHWPSRSRTATSAPMAVMRRPVSGSSCGSVAFSRASERRILRGGIFDACSACAVRSSIRSWKVKRHSLRLPRVGATKPSAISPATMLRDRPSIAWTRRKVKVEASSLASPTALAAFKAR